MKAPVVVAVLALAAVPAASADDFDGDARRELMIAAPGWSPGGAPNAGAVFVIRRGRVTVLMEGSRGIPGVPEGDDEFGAWTAGGDFDGDGHADLAVAAPGDRLTFVIPGSRSGLRRSGVTTIGRAGPMAAGDFDGDGDADLAVGAPDALPARGQDYGAGAVRIYRGARSGLNAQPRILRRPRRLDDAFGSVLAAGDVNGDGRSDLVESSQGEVDASDGEEYPGHVSFCAGSRTGPHRCRSVGKPIGGGPTTLVVADSNGDGFGDIIGGRAVNHYVIDDVPAGGVSIWRGSSAGPRPTPIDITQGSPGIPGAGRPGDEFGAAVAAADVDGDGRAELLIGAPGKAQERGRVVLVRGSASGYSRVGARTLEQGRRGISGAPRALDRFGAAVSIIRLDGDQRPELVVGSPGDRTVTMLRGRRGAVRLTPSSLGLDVPPEPPDASAGFGARLSP